MKKLKFMMVAMVATLISMTLQGQSTIWKGDKSHSSLSFSVDHLVISETLGQFNDYTIDVKADKEDFTDAQFEVVIQAKSIDTKDVKRDEHLRSADFFDVEQFPVISYKGKEFKKIEGNKYQVTGDFTMHGITKSVTFEAQFKGIVKDPWGGFRAGLKLSGEIDRYDYGLKYNSTLEAGGLAIGQMVRIECRVELIKT